MTGSYPNPDKYIQAEHKPFGEVVLAHKREFVIPLNQRPWAWNDKKDVQLLLDDFYRILSAYFDPASTPRWSRRASVERPPHFFGTFVFHKKSAQQYEIFDGQQRLTAVTMMCAVFREAAHELQQQAGPHQAEAGNLIGAFNGWLRVTPTGNQPRLVPNSLFADLFAALIFDPMDQAARKAAYDALAPDVLTHAITKKLKASFDHIYAWVTAQVDGLSADEKINYLKASHDVLHDLFVCIETHILDEQYSYEVFGCLNARGEKLSPADTIKNELFAASQRKDHDHISNRWGATAENVPAQDMSEFLRRRHIALIGPCKKNDTHIQIKEKEIAASNPKALIDSWYQDSRRVSQVLARDAAAFKKESLDSLEMIFDVLGIGLAYIPLLSASKRFLPGDKDGFHECVILIERYVFRTMTIGNTDTSDLERRLGEVARRLKAGDPIASIRTLLKNQSDDVSFENAFAKHQERRPKVQYYILRELETHLLGGGKGVIPGSHHSAKNHIEHMLPKNLSKDKSRQNEWLWARADPVRHQSLVNRLGNLMILESDINKQVGNHEFLVKQNGAFKKVKSGKTSQIKCYADSALWWPQEVAKTATYKAWEESDINERQKKMAADAKVIWAL